MARKHRRRDEAAPPLRPPGALAPEAVETHPDGDWAVRRVTGAGAGKTYRCPGCDQEIPPATPHVVAWSADDPRGAEDRRHWHSGCWAARDRRAPRTTRSRNAPRY